MSTSASVGPTITKDIHVRIKLTVTAEEVPWTPPTGLDQSDAATPGPGVNKDTENDPKHK